MYLYRSFCLFSFLFFYLLHGSELLDIRETFGFWAAEGVNIVRRGEIISGSKKVFVSLYFFFFFLVFLLVGFTVVSIFSLILFIYIYTICISILLFI